MLPKVCVDDVSVKKQKNRKAWDPKLKFRKYAERKNSHKEQQRADRKTLVAG